MGNKSKSGLRTVVKFTSDAFKTVDVEDKPQFRGTFGDDVAIWLMLEMENDGVDVIPGLNQGDAGWCFAYELSGRRYVITVCLYDPAACVWQVQIERDVTGSRAWFGGRRRGVRADAVTVVHRVLSGSDKIASVWWYLERDLRAGREGKASSDPLSQPG